MLKKLIWIPVLTLLISCAGLSANSQKVSVDYILSNCDRLVNKTVQLEARYMGWECPSYCKAPQLTRSDSCVVDSTGCIYVVATGKLNPITDKGKPVVLKAVVKKAPNGICYLKVIEAHPANNNI